MTVEGSRWKPEAKGPLEKRATVSSGKEKGSEDQRPEEMGVAGLLQETLQENPCERAVAGTEAGHAWGPRGRGTVARVTSTLGLGHHSPASARWDTSEREAGVVRWLQARPTQRPAARGLWPGSGEDSGALFPDAREQVAAHVANMGTGGRGGWDTAYRRAPCPSAPGPSAPAGP